MNNIGIVYIHMLLHVQKSTMLTRNTRAFRQRLKFILSITAAQLKDLFIQEEHEKDLS